MSKLGKPVVMVMAGIAAVAGLFGVRKHLKGACETHGEEWPRRFLEHRLEHVLRFLKASPEQKKQIKELVTPLLEGGMKLRADLRQIRKSLLESLMGETPDKEKARETIDAHLEAARTLLYQGMEAISKIQSILTPEQREELRQRLSKRHHCCHC